MTSHLYGCDLEMTFSWAWYMRYIAYDIGLTDLNYNIKNKFMKNAQKRLLNIVCEEKYKCNARLF